ncbi:MULTISPECIES: DJ-1/PfpI family protein [Streptomyces]|uniref:DJ-1/PfpI family protein n=1 Tax=Streptomyces acidicola TaxID=2596892 RepID=A0A5N8X2P0_9ACTN|nr:DJ-1/PfpI family protein [Streptomyces acidicola]MPY53819.1 DJ-1/PfpI family protein [Streptomyces acidicola]
MNIAVVLFPRLTALDAVGPYETLQRLPDTTVTFVGHQRGEVRTENGYLGLTIDKTFDEVVAPDVVIVPGGIGVLDLLEDKVLLDWLRSVHATSRFTTSVCTGSLLLAAAGLLPGLEATTHWAFMDKLTELGAVPTSTRVVEHLEQRTIIAAGVSSGIDMALRLAELLTDQVTAQAMQLMVEYDPQPPFDAGSVVKAGPLVTARARELFQEKD